jgi:hypothetical protein
MAKKGKRTGGKFTSSHTSAIPASWKVVDFLSSLPEVKKISLGIIKAGKFSGGKRYIKLKKRRGGFLMTVRGNSSIQEIAIYTNSQDELIESLKNRSFEFNMDVL